MPIQAKVHRSVITQQRASCAAAAQISEEPFKQQYLDIVTQCDVVLAVLPADDQPLSDAHVSSVASLLAGSVALCTLLTNALDNSKKILPTSIASGVTTEITRLKTSGELFDKTSLASAVSAEVKRLAEAGEIVPKASVDQLCSAAKTNGIAEGEKKVRDEVATQQLAAQKITERKTALQTASFPLPEVDQFLTGSDEDFTARKTKAETRKTALQTAGFQLPPELLGNVWLDDPAYAGFEKLINGIPALKTKAEALAGGGAGGAPSIPI